MESQESDTQKPDIEILMLGLDDAGKTTLLYKLKLGDADDLKTIPTIGFNVETIEFQDKNYTFWDIGCGDTVRVLWKFYAENKAAVIFVIDVSNPARFTEAKDFLHTIMAHEDLSNVMLLVVFNKHDKNTCLSDDELVDELNLKTIKQQSRIIKISAFDRQSLNKLMTTLQDINLPNNN